MMVKPVNYNCSVHLNKFSTFHNSSKIMVVMREGMENNVIQDMETIKVINKEDGVIKHQINLGIEIKAGEINLQTSLG